MIGLSGRVDDYVGRTAQAVHAPDYYQPHQLDSEIHAHDDEGDYDASKPEGENVAHVVSSDACSSLVLGNGNRHVHIRCHCVVLLRDELIENHRK